MTQEQMYHHLSNQIFGLHMTVVVVFLVLGIMCASKK